MLEAQIELEVENWPIGRFVPYARNPRKNDAAVDRSAAVSVNSVSRSGVGAQRWEVVDGHLRLKAARRWGYEHAGDSVR